MVKTRQNKQIKLSKYYDFFFKNNNKKIQPSHVKKENKAKHYLFIIHSTNF